MQLNTKNIGAFYGSIDGKTAAIKSRRIKYSVTLILSQIADLSRL